MSPLAVSAHGLTGRSGDPLLLQQRLGRLLCHLQAKDLAHGLFLLLGLVSVGQHFEERLGNLPVAGGQLADIAIEGITGFGPPRFVHAAQEIVGGDFERVCETAQRVEGRLARS